ncbi:hypothetical protein NDU88_005215 [Pleurodeles waltl]|uniref:Uncharacterized protein n=1 Tax=Pleurodeles waltl TaxID=8319 RepID=A0AAV7RLQ4_PLEWA|nr:hypothetical protein NDU88_005215 [Pleurodeles waltl]
MAQLLQLFEVVEPVPGDDGKNRSGGRDGNNSGEEKDCGNIRSGGGTAGDSGSAWKNSDSQGDRVSTRRGNYSYPRRSGWRRSTLRRWANCPGSTLCSGCRDQDMVSNNSGSSTTSAIEGPGGRKPRDPATLWGERGLGRYEDCGLIQNSHDTSGKREGDRQLPTVF